MRSWGRLHSPFGECRELPASGWSYVHVKDVDWTRDTIFPLIPNQTIYDIRIAPANMAEVPPDILEYIEGELDLTQITEIEPGSDHQQRGTENVAPAGNVKFERPGRKPELKDAMKEVFSNGLKDPEVANQLTKMSQNGRRRYVGKTLGLPEDEWPSRSWCEEVWKESWSQAALPEL
jgi:hypothetical protein